MSERYSSAKENMSERYLVKENMSERYSSAKENMSERYSSAKK